jgi:hypothetical protein
MEAEYMATCEACKMRVWIREFIDEFDVVPSIIKSMKLYYDNTRAITNVKDHRSNKQTMHIKHMYRIICEFVENGDIKMYKLGTESNTIDPLTKLLPLAKHVRHIGTINIRYMRDWF